MKERKENKTMSIFNIFQFIYGGKGYTVNRKRLSTTN